MFLILHFCFNSVNFTLLGRLCCCCLFDEFFLLIFCLRILNPSHKNHFPDQYLGLFLWKLHCSLFHSFCLQPSITVYKIVVALKCIFKSGSVMPPAFLLLFLLGCFAYSLLLPYCTIYFSSHFSDRATAMLLLYVLKMK